VNHDWPDQLVGLGGTGAQVKTSDRYKAYASRASDELEQKQDRLLADYGIGTFADFFFDQTTGKLTFKDSRGRVRLEADVTPLGSFSCRTKTWCWAWANESFLPELQKRAAVLKGLHKIGNKDLFDRASFKASETKAWELTAVCVRYLKSCGCYRIPRDHLYVFLALDNVAERRGSKNSQQARR
jgi:hypothetical protein